MNEDLFMTFFINLFNPIKVAGWGSTNQEATASEITPSSRLISINIDIFPNFWNYLGIPDYMEDQCEDRD